MRGQKLADPRRAFSGSGPLFSHYFEGPEGPGAGQFRGVSRAIQQHPIFAPLTDPRALVYRAIQPCDTAARNINNSRHFAPYRAIHPARHIGFRAYGAGGLYCIATNPIGGDRDTPPCSINQQCARTGRKSY